MKKENAPTRERGRSQGEKTPDPQTREVEALGSQESEGTILALGAIPLRGISIWGVHPGPGRLRGSG